MPEAEDPKGGVPSAGHLASESTGAPATPGAPSAPITSTVGRPENAAPAPGLPATRWSAASFSRMARLLATVLVFASLLLMSPPRGQTYPGAKPWSSFSLLKPLTDLMSLDGLVATERGVEIKDFVFHLAATAGLALLALRLATRTAGRTEPRVFLRRLISEPWLAAQLLLVGWVVISALSALWSGDAALSHGQAVLYGLALAWAISLAWTLQRQDVSKLLAATAGACTAAAVLCIWYYYERNPYHRPGFPVGNPITLGAALAPAILICLGMLLAAGESLLKGQRVAGPRAAIAAAVALVPLLWCFVLADSRSAGLGLAGGIIALALLRVGPRLRWAVIGVALTVGLAAGLWLMQYSRLDAAMGRSATIRFRLYAWRYAAELWDKDWLTAVAGNGAGQYPRLAGQYSLRDRRFDPNAFMGDMVEHAHNELFEVLSEIGLVGGVTFVAGLLGTLVAGGLLLRSRPRDAQSWLYTGLLAAVVAMMIDACFSPGLRLSVLPALFFTLMGMLWAACREAAAEPATAIGKAAVARKDASGARAAPAMLPAVGVAGLALAAAYFALQNGWGVLNEEWGRQAAEAREYDRAYRCRAVAEACVLDPVRVLIDDACAGQALLNGAVVFAQEHAQAQRPADSAPAGDSDLNAGAGSNAPASAQVGSASATETALTPAQHAALQRGMVAFEHAVRLMRRAPTILGAARMEAGAAQLLSELYASFDAERAGEWARRAAQAWLTQRGYRPYDFETLLMLTKYHWPPAEGLHLLCDALRATDAHTLAGRPLSFEQMRSAWRDALRRFDARQGFDEALDHFLAVVGPLDPQTDVDTLIASRAPEVYRVAAYAAAERGDFSTARNYAARAVALYEPMRARFPSLSSAALLEQAEFALLETPANAPQTANLLNQAIARLPTIQEQKQEALLQPYRHLLVLALLAQGQESEARALLPAGNGDELNARLADSYVELARFYIRQVHQDRPDVEPWLAAAIKRQPDNLWAWSWRAWLAAEAGDHGRVDAVLRAAGGAGVAPQDVAHIRRSLCQEFPSFCGADSSTR
jgi:O-antigen ligase